MPEDNSSSIGPGFAVQFPQDGPAHDDDIARVSNDTFNLEHEGTYLVMFQVSVDESGQLVVALDSGAGVQELDYTVVGRDAENSQIVGMALVRTTERNSLLSVRNPSDNNGSLTITPFAGSDNENPVSAHLVITRLH